MFRKDGKIFGKISIIDIGAIALVLLLVCGVYIKFFANDPSRKVSASGDTFECVVMVKNVRDYTVEALEKGGLVMDSTTKEHIGEITGVTYEPGENRVSMADGSYLMAPVENRFNVYVTIEFSGKEGATGYFTDTNKQISTGGTLLMSAKYAKCEGTIVSVNKK